MQGQLNEVRLHWRCAVGEGLAKTTVNTKPKTPRNVKPRTHVRHYTHHLSLAFSPLTSRVLTPSA